MIRDFGITMLQPFLSRSLSMLVAISFSTFAMTGAAFQSHELPSSEAMESETEWDSESREAVSYLHSFAANAAAHVRGDVLVVTRRTWDSVGPEESLNLDGSVVRHVVLTRFRFDYQTGQFLVVQAVDAERLDLAMSDPQTGDPMRVSRGEQLFAFIVDPVEERTGNFDGRRLHEMRLKPGIEKGVVNPLVPEFRTLGLFATTGLPLSEIEPNLRFFESARKPGSVSHVKDRITVRTHLGNGPKDRPDGYFEHVLDAGTLMPVEACLMFRVPETGEWGPMRPRVRLAWQEMAGVFVPISFEKAERRDGAEFLVPGVEGEYTETMEFKWLQLNEELEAGSFDIEHITSEPRVRELLSFGEKVRGTR